MIPFRLVYLMITTVLAIKNKNKGAYLLPMRPHLNSSVTLLNKLAA